ncbi:MAG: hypothetical protein HFE63_03045 [Clostridiales bacterium]|nr:hypothetical protein [Clostridiales bacterium]
MCKSTYSKILAALLATLILLPSCASTSDDSKSQDSSIDSAKSTEPTTEVNYLDTISKKDFGGDTFRVYVNSASDRPNLHAGEENGEVINDSMYNRDMTVGDMFKCKIEYTSYEDKNALYKDVVRLISAGDDFADIIITSLFEGVGTLAASEMLVDIGSLDGINISADWWCQSMNETMIFNDKLYAVSGPMALCYCYAPYAFFANLDMAEDFGLESVYDLVNSSKWTIDKMSSMMKDIYFDVNSNGVVDSEDRFPMTMTLESGKAFYIGCGMRMAEKSTNGDVKMNIDSQKSIDILDMLNAIMKPEEVICTDKLAKTWAVGVSDYKTAMFKNSQALFCASPIQWGVLNFRDMNDDYAILPYPKYDEAQDEYYSHLNSYFPVGVAIPKTCQRAEMAAPVMEALAYISYNEVLPKIHGVVLKEKVARDENSKDMIDLLYKNVIVDFNAVFNFGNSSTMLREYAVGESDNFVSAYASIKTKVETELNEILEKLSQ